MDAITASVNTAPAPVIPTLAPVSSQPISNPAPAQASVSDQVDLSSQAAQQQAAQPKVEYANPQVLGTQAVTMYMVNGQLYTRYRDEVTNKVTYIPNEAQILSGSGSESAPQPVLDITA